MGVMTLAYVIGSIFLWVPTLLVNVAKSQEAYVKYVLIFCAIGFVTINASTLAYHVVILYIYAIAIASLYFSKRLNVLTTVFTVLGVSAGQVVCFAMDVFTDKNFTTLYKLIVYGIVPRALVLTAIAAIFTMLCQRTAGMLSNLLNAQEQERMMNEMKQLQEKSRQTSDELFHVVKELSVITEASMKALDSVRRLSGGWEKNLRRYLELSM